MSRVFLTSHDTYAHKSTDLPTFSVTQSAIEIVQIGLLTD